MTGDFKHGRFESDRPCPDCEFGALRPDTATCARWFGGQFITVPDFPVWACQVCGHTQYDAKALQQLGALLGSSHDLQQSAHRPAHRAQRDRRVRTPGSSRWRV